MTRRSGATITAVVCAFNEAGYISACLHSLLAQTRPPDEIIVVDNASTDGTAVLARAVTGVTVTTEPVRGLVMAREAGRRAAHGDVLAHIDADCRPPLTWLARVERRFATRPALVAVTGPYRFYDWDPIGSARRYRAIGKWTVFGLYVRNFWSEILRHRPADRTHVDVRA